MPPPVKQSGKFEKPRIIGGPLICIATNLPAFRDFKSAKQYFDRYCPSMGERERIECESCGYVHITHHPLEISGQTSGKHKRKDTNDEAIAIERKLKQLLR